MKVNQVKRWFLRRGETGVPGENLSVQSREPTNSTHIWRRVRESNPGHIGRRRVLSPLRHILARPFTPPGGFFICFTLHDKKELFNSIRRPAKLFGKLNFLSYERRQPCICTLYKARRCLNHSECALYRDFTTIDFGYLANTFPFRRLIVLISHSCNSFSLNFLTNC